MSLARIARLRHPAPWVADLALVLLFAGPVLGTAVAQASSGEQLYAGLLGLLALSAIFARRRWPVPALTVAGTAGAFAPHNAGAVLIPALLILYTISTRRPWPAPVPMAVAIVAASAAGEIVAGHPERVTGAIGVAIECAAAVAWGLYVGARRTTLDALRDRADRADRERELLADRAVAEERVRIAQDLHDVVAHNVSLMVVQAQALGVTVDDDRVRTTTDAIADLGRQAMTEMHRTLRLLRADAGQAAERAPQPTLANLDRLIEQTRATGMDVRLTIEGQPRPLGETVELSAFRIVQEALTNVVKHAGRARTTVTVAFRESGLELRITDAGHGRLPAPVGDPDADGGGAGGHGLIGMRERAALFGGTLTAAPRLGDGFEVRAVLPYTDPAGQG